MLVWSRGRRARSRARSRAVDATVAVVAHADRTNDVARLLRAYAGVLGRIRFLAPAGTARALSGIPIDVRAEPGRAGDGLGLARSVEEGRVQAFIFFGCLGTAAEQPELVALLRACDEAGIPLATNVATAEIVIRHLTSNQIPPFLQLVSITDDLEDRSSAG